MRPTPAGNASPLRKKVLGEINCGGDGGVMVSPPQLNSVPSPPSLAGRGAGPYDPKTNYTAPRPEFLRYDPECHREMLLRLARAPEVEEDDSSSATSGTAASEAAGSSISSAPGSDSEVELDYSDGAEEEEEEVVPAGKGRWARRLFLLLVAVICLCCYNYCMNPTPFPIHSEDGIAFTGPVERMHDAGVHELDSEDVVHQYDQRASPKNLMAVAMMGLADVCPSVQLGESGCSIGDENNETMDGLKENSELAEQNAAVMMDSFEDGDQNISWHATQTIDTQDGSSVLVHQEEGEDYSNQFVPQLVSMEKAIGSASNKLDYKMDSGSQGLDHDTELWQYEQTAEAAKEMSYKIKFLWSAMEHHLLGMLACLSVAGLVGTIFKYYPRSRKMAVPASQQMSSKSLKEVPVLVPHQNVQLPVSPPPLAVQLPVPKQDLSGSLEVPMQLKSGSIVSFKDPEQLAMPKTDPSVSLKAPMVDHGNHVQKIQKGNAETFKASLGNSQYHRENDVSKPPVVELLGEFTFGDSSRGKSIRNSDQHAGHVSVQESLGVVADKMPMNSSILQSPIVGRAMKEVTSACSKFIVGISF
jgi:hypothetical protein